MKAEQSKFAESMKASENEGHPDATFEPDASSSTAVASEETRPVCSLCRDSDSKSPLCYLILLQVIILDSTMVILFSVVICQHKVPFSVPCAKAWQLDWKFSVMLCWSYSILTCSII